MKVKVGLKKHLYCGKMWSGVRVGQRVISVSTEEETSVMLLIYCRIFSPKKQKLNIAQ